MKKFVCFVLGLLVSISVAVHSDACEDKKKAVEDAQKRIEDAREAITVAEASRNVNMIGAAAHHVKSNSVSGYQSGSYDPAGQMQRYLNAGVAMSDLSAAERELEAAESALETAEQELHDCENPMGPCGHPFPGHGSMEWTCGHTVYICQLINHVRLECYHCKIHYYTCGSSTCMAGGTHL